MRFRALMTAGLGVVVLMACVAAGGAEGQVVDGLPILVRVSLDSNFKNDTERKRNLDNLEDDWDRHSRLIGALEPREIEESFASQLKARLGSWATSNTIKAVFCESEEELTNKAKNNQGYMALSIMLTEREATEEEPRDSFALKARVQLYRLTGGRWEKLADGRYEAKQADRKKGIEGKSDITAMVDLLDGMVARNAVAFEPLSSTSLDARTKVIRLRLWNPSSYDVTLIKWLVPSSKSVLTAKSEGRLKPGAAVNLDITVTSEGSHSAIQWRDVRIGEIKFAKPGK